MLIMMIAFARLLDVDGYSYVFLSLSLFWYRGVIILFNKNPARPVGMMHVLSSDSNSDILGDIRNYMFGDIRN